MKVVAKVVPAFRVSILVSVVLERSSKVPLACRMSLPVLPVTEPPEIRSA